jgi:hypothetical protein
MHVPSDLHLYYSVVDSEFEPGGMVGHEKAASARKWQFKGNYWAVVGGSSYFDGFSESWHRLTVASSRTTLYALNPQFDGSVGGRRGDRLR